MKRYHSLRVFAVWILLFFFSLLFMFKTFSYDNASHTFRISNKLWSDFSAHIPLIRSFSMGGNLFHLVNGEPIESPLFPGEPIRYHIGFYVVVGILEKLGLPIDWAINVPSALGLVFIMMGIFYIGSILFKQKMVGFLAVIFFLFNGSLSFIRFFRVHPLSWNSINDIVTNTSFPAFGPWDNQEITAFWNLNVYTNQRHLAFSYGLVLLGYWILIQPRKATPFEAKTIILILLLNTLLFTNYVAFALFTLFAGWSFIFMPHIRKSLIIMAICTIPMYLFIQSIANIPSSFIYQPGYLVQTPVSIDNFIRFWFMNLGLHMLLIPLGMILSPHRAKLLLIPPLLVAFIVPNLYRFSPDMINNHKFFNFAIIIGGLFSAYAICQIYTLVKHIRIRIFVILSYCLTVLLFLFSTLSGVIDFFAIVHDGKGILSDVSANPDAVFIARHLTPDDRILNSRWLYHPASLSGRLIFAGYPYFTWSYGYDKAERERVVNMMYNASRQSEVCDLLQSYIISWVELQKKTEDYIIVNRALWNSFSPAYTNPASGLTLYEVKTICATN